MGNKKNYIGWACFCDNKPVLLDTILRRGFYKVYKTKKEALFVAKDVRKVTIEEI